MRNVLLFLLLSVSSALWAGDDFDSVLKEGKVWRYRFRLVVNPVYGEVYHFKELCLSGDTLIEGIPFKRVKERQLPDGEGTSVADWMPTNFWIGEKSGRVYTYEEFTKYCKLLFDFSAAKGETIEGASRQWRVTAVTDTIIGSGMDKKARHCLHVANVENPYRTDVWVEGIGSLSTGLINADDLDGAIPTLILCSDETVLYQNTSSLSKINSPIPSLNQNRQYFYDLQGRPMKETPQKGLYIKDGKKTNRIIMNK